MRACKVCGGTGWMTYPHPDGEGGMGLATGPCMECVTDGICARCGEGMMEYGALRICVHCGFTFDEADEPEPAVAGRIG